MKTTFEIDYQENVTFDLLAASLVAKTNLLINAKNTINNNLELSKKVSTDVCNDFVNYLNSKVVVFEVAYCNPIITNLVTVESKFIEFLIYNGAFNSINAVRFNVRFELNEFCEIIDINYICRALEDNVVTKFSFEHTDIDSVLLRFINVFDYYHKRRYNIV